MVIRTLQKELQSALFEMPVVALLGPRQVGKTTLSLQIAGNQPKKTHYFDLESDADFNKFSDAEAFLKRFEGELLILDEVQRMPELFRMLRGIVDHRKRTGEGSCQFLFLGSASREMLQQTSETLAGRIRFLELSPFSVQEISENEGIAFNLERLWLRGGFPDSYLAASEDSSWKWRRDFVSTYLERDLPMMGVGLSPVNLKRFWKMLAHYHGNLVNLSELGRSLELSHTTIKKQLDLLTDFYMVRQLQPWSGNIKKRLVKAPKIYLRDTGILHYLLNATDMTTLVGHPMVGGSWEGFVIENIIRLLDDRWVYSYFRSATQMEIDLVLESPKGKIWAIEIKKSTTPKLGRGFFEACNDIGATHRWVIHGGKDRYPLPNNVEAIGLAEFLSLIS